MSPEAELFARLDLEMWDDTSFTCDEADALAALLDSVGANNHAEALREAHATGDWPGDRHHQEEQ